MSPVALSLVLSAACIHATWNLLSKKARGGMEFVWMYATIGTLFYGPWAISEYAAYWHRLTAWHALSLAGSCTLQLLYFICLQRAYQHGEFSLVYPIARGTGPLIAAVGAITLYREEPSAMAYAGICLITGSVLFFVRGAPHMAVSIRYGLLTGFFIGTYSLWDKYAVASLGLPPIVIEWTTDLSRALLLLPLAGRRRPDVRRIWTEFPKLTVAVGILNPLSYLLVLTAMQMTALSYIAPMREISIVIGAVLGARLLGEPQPARRIIGAAVMVCGVVVLALG